MFPFAKKALSNLFKKPSTVPYPEVPAPAQPAYRGRISYDAEKCVNCGMCIKVCSPGAIVRTSAADPQAGGEHITYTFDLTSCTFCGSCQDFCSTKAIVLTEDYHMVAEDARDLQVTGTRFKKDVKGRLSCDQSACVYCGLCARTCPEGAITVDRASKTWTLNEEECVKCGRCIEKCPKKCLSFAEGGEEGVLMGDACVYCTLCAKNCPVGAITVDRASKTWEIDREACIKCGQCISTCPRKTLSLGPLPDPDITRFSAGEKPAAPKSAAEAKPSPAQPVSDQPVQPQKTEPAQPQKTEPAQPQKTESGKAAKAAPGQSEKASPAKTVKSAAQASATLGLQTSDLIPAASYEWEQGIRLGPECIYCTACARKCPMEAIHVDRAAKTWEIDREKCVLCGICVSTCPKKTLSLGDLEKSEDIPAGESLSESSKTQESFAAGGSAPEAPSPVPAPKSLGVQCAEGCIQCGACAGVCPAGAITVDGEWSIDRDACIQCGACVSACPVGVLSIQ